MNQKKIEIFHGHNNNIVMSDLYKLSVSNIRKSLQFQKKIGVEKFRVLILVDEVLDNKITNVISKFKPDIFLQLSKDDKIDIDIKSSIVLVRGSDTHKILKQLKIKNLPFDFYSVQTNFYFQCAIFRTIFLLFSPFQNTTVLQKSNSDNTLLLIP